MNSDEQKATRTEHRATLSRRWLKRGLIAALALAAGGFALRNVILGKPVETYAAVRSDLVQSVVASGRVATTTRFSRRG